MNYKEEVIKDETIFESKGTLLELFKNIFSIKNIFCFLIMYMVSKLQFTEGVTPFSYAMLGAMSVFNVPILITIIGGSLGILSGGFATAVVYKYLITAIIFLVISAFIKIEGLNKKATVILKLIFSVAVVEGVSLFIADSLMLSMFNTMYQLITISIFYLLFQSAMFVTVNFRKAVVFSTEELISFAIMIALAICAFGDIQILHLTISNIVCIILVLIIGYKNGAVAGCCVGAVMGLILGIVTDAAPLYISTFAFSGLLSGLFNRLGKFGVVVGFVIGNLAVTYYLNGEAELLQGFREILVASTFLMFMPKKLEIRIDSLFNRNMMLASSFGNYLSDSEDVKIKLENISNVFENLATNIDTVKIEEADKGEVKLVIRDYLNQYKETNCLGCNNYKTCLANNESALAIDYFIDSLENRNNVKDNLIPVACNKGKEIQHEVKLVYNNIKLAYILKQKEQENAKNISKQYKEVSKLINTMAKNLIPNKRRSADIKLEETIKQELKLFGYNIYDSEYYIESGITMYTFITDLLKDIDMSKEEIQNVVSSVLDKDMQINLILNSSKTEKAKIRLVSKKPINIYVEAAATASADVSGDNYISCNINEDKSIVALSDGEGVGIEASKVSKSVLSMIEQLLRNNLDKTNMLQIINNILKIKGENSRFATIDLAVVNKTTDEIEFIKYGAAPTYLISNKKLTVIDSSSLPAGLNEEVQYVPHVKKIKAGDTLIMLSDGALPEEDREKNNQALIAKLRSYDEFSDIKKISNELLKFSKEEFNSPDDITILVIKIV
ncbi:MAG: SpoIIE family protein phosphatase [Clostridia bacterium]